MGGVGDERVPPVVDPERSLARGMEGRALGAGRVGGAGGEGTWAGMGTCGRDAGGWTRAAGAGRGRPRDGGKSGGCGPRPGTPPRRAVTPPRRVGLRRGLEREPSVAFLCCHRLVRKSV